MTNTEKKYLNQIQASGYISVSKIDSLYWRRRQILNDMVGRGILRMYSISPSYDGYALA